MAFEDFDEDRLKERVIHINRVSERRRIELPDLAAVARTLRRFLDDGAPLDQLTP